MIILQRYFKDIIRRDYYGGLMSQCTDLSWRILRCLFSHRQCMIQYRSFASAIGNPLTFPSFVRLLFVSLFFLSRLVFAATSHCLFLRWLASVQGQCAPFSRIVLWIQLRVIIHQLLSSISPGLAFHSWLAICRRNHLVWLPRMGSSLMQQWTLALRGRKHQLGVRHISCLVWFLEPCMYLYQPAQWVKKYSSMNQDQSQPPSHWAPHRRGCFRASDLGGPPTSHCASTWQLEQFGVWRILLRLLPWLHWFGIRRRSCRAHTLKGCTPGLGWLFPTPSWFYRRHRRRSVCWCSCGSGRSEGWSPSQYT